MGWFPPGAKGSYNRGRRREKRRAATPPRKQSFAEGAHDQSLTLVTRRKKRTKGGTRESRRPARPEGTARH